MPEKWVLRVYRVDVDTAGKDGRVGTLEGDPFAAATLTSFVPAGYTGREVFVFTKDRLSG